jgi:hypothetical protein
VRGLVGDAAVQQRLAHPGGQLGEPAVLARQQHDQRPDRGQVVELLQEAAGQRRLGGAPDRAALEPRPVPPRAVQLALEDRLEHLPLGPEVPVEAAAAGGQPGARLDVGDGGAAEPALPGPAPASRP